MIVPGNHALSESLRSIWRGVGEKAWPRREKKKPDSSPGFFVAAPVERAS
jgi:hypothetical protein